MEDAGIGVGVDSAVGRDSDWGLACKAKACTMDSSYGESGRLRRVVKAGRRGMAVGDGKKKVNTYCVESETRQQTHERYTIRLFF